MKLWNFIEIVAGAGLHSVGIATVNVEGNGMDIGHPLGAAGARITCKAEALSGR